MSPDLYLSRLSVEASAVINPYEIHRLLWSVFPGMPDASRPFLFHLGPSRGDARRKITMLSAGKPSRTQDGRLMLHDCRVFSPYLRAGQRLKFELRANPVKRLADSGVRVPLIRDEERLAWLVRRFEGAAKIENARIIASERLFFRKAKTGAGKVETATFSGVLRVVEVERFLEKCRSGLGPAKSFGCGLLLLSKA